MKGKVNVKTIIVLIILLLVVVLGVVSVSVVRTYITGAASGVAPSNVVAKPSEDGKTAVISWVSDKPSMGVVEYGTTAASLLLRAIENDAVTSHRLSLSSLKPGTTYYYRIRVGDEIFDNGGVPYSFKTASGESGVTENPDTVLIPQPTVPPVSSQPATEIVCDKTTDYNNDGVVNSLDYMTCIKNPGSVTVVPTTAPSTSGGDCVGGVDYNNDGVINSLDRIQCLQDNR